MTEFVYILLNCNSEGTNFRGVYDDLDKAIQASEKSNAVGRELIKTLWDGEQDKEELERSLEFYDWWEITNVILKCKVNTNEQEVAWEHPNRHRLGAES